MDPKATLQRLLAAMQKRDYADAVAALNDYYQWRVKGGFEPPRGDECADNCANLLADALEEVS